MANRIKKNPRNQESSLYKSLTRLLSGPVVNYRRQTPRRERRRNLDKYKFQSATGQQFKKSSYDPFESLTSNILANQNRVERYADFEQMEYEPIIASAIDIYADEMSTSSDLNPLLRIKCPNEEIKSILNHLYYNIMNLEFNLFGWCRSMCKFGDYFLYLDIDESTGIQNVMGLPGAEVERIEGEDKSNPNYVQYQWNSGGLTFENWQVAHFRILGNDKWSPYGTSVLEPARRIWRQLILLEDAVMAYRIVRSPDRRVFYIDVGSINPDDVEQYMQKVMTQMKRNQVVDPTSGRVDLRYNPLSIEEDYFIPVRGQTHSRVENLGGGSYTGDIDDIKYLKDKLFAALKIPQAYLFRGEGAEEDKATLAQKDIRFARTVQRLQRSVTAELEKIGIIHLYTLGYRQEDLISFSISLNNPSKIAELQEMEQWKARFDAAQSATEGFFSKRWVAEHLLGLSHDEFIRNQREMFYDRKFDAMLTAEAEAATEAAAGLEAGGEELGDLGDLGGEELGGEELGGEAALGGEELGGEAEAEAPAEEEGPLLSAPANRDDEIWYKMKRKNPAGKTQTTTSKSKGRWYVPAASRGGDKRKDAGPRTKNYARKGSPEISKRTTLPGLDDLSSLASGLYESKDTTYNEEERKIFEVNHEVKKLINELEKKEKKVETETQQKA